MSSPSPPSDTAFKVRGTDSYHRFTLAAGEGLFDRLLEALRERQILFRKLFWIDEEGDRIALSNVLDMKDATSTGNQLVRLEVELQPEVIVQEANTPAVETPSEHFIAERRPRRAHRRSRSRSPHLTHSLPHEYAHNAWYPAPNQVYWRSPGVTNPSTSRSCRYCKH